MPILLQPVSDFEAPDDFPVQPYLDIHCRIARTQSESDERSEFFFAWTAIAYRYKACVDHDARYTDSVTRAGNTPPYPDRYLQDEELFNFFTTGHSAVESACYAFYAVGAMIQPCSFPFTTDTHRRKVDPNWTADKFAKAFPGAPIVTALQTMLASQQYIEWKTIRNILNHRTAPGRFISIGGGQTAVEWKTVNISLDQMTTASRLTWLAQTLEGLIAAAAMLPI